MNPVQECACIYATLLYMYATSVVCVVSNGFVSASMWLDEGIEGVYLHYLMYILLQWGEFEQAFSLLRCSM